MNKFLLLSLLLSVIAIPCQAQWIQLNDAPFETNHSNAFGFDGKGYIIKGTPDVTGGVSKNQLWEYDPVTDAWTLQGPIEPSSRTYAIGDDMNGKYYFGFGIGQTDLWEFDPTDNSFTELPSCPCQPRAHPAFVAHQDKIYMGSGTGSNSDLQDWWVYDMNTQQWSQKANIPGGNRHHPFQFGIGDEIFVGGGHKTSWSKFNVNTETWSPIDNFPSSRVAGTQFSFNNIGFVLSGDATTHAHIPNNQFLMYNPSDDEWYDLPFDDHMHRWAPSSFIIGNILYYFGGVTYIGNDDGDMWKFDLSSVTCIAPSNIFAVDVTDNSAGLFFNSTPTGTVDTLQWREEGATTWNNIANPVAVLELNNLSPCTTYEFRLSVVCGTNISIYSEISSFLTKGCGACLDLEYCSVIDEFNAYTCFINRVKIDSEDNITGTNEGYEAFTSFGNTEISAGETFYLEVEPGYSGSAQTGNLKVWIDLNADGIFEPDELILDETPVTQLYAGNIEIPLDATSGPSRMRIAFDVNNVPGSCEGTFFNDGEVEDYCITITGGLSSTPGINEDQAIAFYPNPTTGELFLENATGESADITLYDINGRTVFQYLDAQTKIDISDLSNGVYFMRIHSGESSYVKKLIKQ